MKVNYKGFFIKKRECINISELSKKIDIANASSLDPNDKIYDVKILTKATKDDVSFLSNVKYLPQLKETKAGFCFIQKQYQDVITNGITKPIVVDNPHYAYTVLLNEFFSAPLFEVQNGISDKAVISKTAKIGNNVEIQAGVVIFDDVVIGNNCKICANAVINHNCIMGDNNYIGANTTISYTIMGNNNIIQNNVSLGHCGFGFAHNKGVNHKIPQLGLVRIGNNVEIGMGCSVARGALDNTEIGDMTKIDCLTHIAHGVKVGMGCFFAGQVGVAGSAEIGAFCQIGGQTAINGHIRVGNFNEIAGRSGIVKSTNDGARLGGFPAVNLRDWHRQTIVLNKLIKKSKNDE
jgi:UDP-3-O-[3-hydroxymyristoyl] glucosamine N-acyltransferase